MIRLLLISVLLVPLSGMAQTIDDFFSAPVVHRVEIDFELLDYWDSLTHYKTITDEQDIKNYIRADVVIDSFQFDDVGMRFRGFSSYGHPGTKKPYQIDFNEFVDSLNFLGLKKINLSNSYLDPTQIREKLFLHILNELGIPAPRSAYTEVYVEGEYVGLYKFIEPIKKHMLQDRFGDNDGNLYKGEPDSYLGWEGADQSAYYDNCELKTNEAANDWSDLVNLIDQINHTPTNQYHDLMTDHLNLDDFIFALAANNVFGNLDSYQQLPHNYYLYYNETTNRFEWIVWDVSLAFGVYALLVVPESVDYDLLHTVFGAPSKRPLVYHTFENPVLRQQYLNHVCQLLSTKFSAPELFPRIDSLANVIRPYVQAEPGENQMFSNNQFEQNLGYGEVSFSLIGRVPGIKDFIVSRTSNLRRQLCDLGWSCALGSEVATGDDAILFYPNPGSRINASFSSPVEHGNVDFTLYDLSGRKMWTDRYVGDGSSEFQLDLGTLPNGVYVMDVGSSCQEGRKKIVVSH